MQSNKVDPYFTPCFSCSIICQERCPIYLCYTAASSLGVPIPIDFSCAVSKFKIINLTSFHPCFTRIEPVNNLFFVNSPFFVVCDLIGVAKSQCCSGATGIMCSKYSLLLNHWYALANHWYAAVE